MDLKMITAVIKMKIFYIQVNNLESEKENISLNY